MSTNLWTNLSEPYWSVENSSVYKLTGISMVSPDQPMQSDHKNTNLWKYLSIIVKKQWEQSHRETMLTKPVLLNVITLSWFWLCKGCTNFLLIIWAFPVKKTEVFKDNDFFSIWDNYFIIILAILERGHFLSVNYFWDRIKY